MSIANVINLNPQWYRNAGMGPEMTEKPAPSMFSIIPLSKGNLKQNGLIPRMSVNNIEGAQYMYVPFYKEPDGGSVGPVDPLLASNIMYSEYYTGYPLVFTKPNVKIVLGAYDEETKEVMEIIAFASDKNATHHTCLMTTMNDEFAFEIPFVIGATESIEPVSAFMRWLPGSPGSIYVILLVIRNAAGNIVKYLSWNSTEGLDSPDTAINAGAAVMCFGMSKTVGFCYQTLYILDKDNINNKLVFRYSLFDEIFNISGEISPFITTPTKSIEISRSSGVLDSEVVDYYLHDSTIFAIVKEQYAASFKYALYKISVFRKNIRMKLVNPDILSSMNITGSISNIDIKLVSFSIIYISLSIDSASYIYRFDTSDNSFSRMTIFNGKNMSFVPIQSSFNHLPCLFIEEGVDIGIYLFPPVKLTQLSNNFPRYKELVAGTYPGLQELPISLNMPKIMYDALKNNMGFDPANNAYLDYLFYGEFHYILIQVTDGNVCHLGMIEIMATVTHLYSTDVRVSISPTPIPNIIGYYDLPKPKLIIHNNEVCVTYLINNGTTPHSYEVFIAKMNDTNYTSIIGEITKGFDVVTTNTFEIADNVIVDFNRINDTNYYIVQEYNGAETFDGISICTLVGNALNRIKNFTELAATGSLELQLKQILHVDSNKYYTLAVKEGLVIKLDTSLREYNESFVSEYVIVEYDSVLDSTTVHKLMDIPVDGYNLCPTVKVFSELPNKIFMAALDRLIIFDTTSKKLNVVNNTNHYMDQFTRAYFTVDSIVFYSGAHFVQLSPEGLIKDLDLVMTGGSADYFKIKTGDYVSTLFSTSAGSDGGGGK